MIIFVIFGLLVQYSPVDFVCLHLSSFNMLQWVLAKVVQQVVSLTACACVCQWST